MDADNQLFFIFVELGDQIEGLLYFLVFLLEDCWDSVDFGLHKLEVFDQKLLLVNVRFYFEFQWLNFLRLGCWLFHSILQFAFKLLLYLFKFFPFDLLPFMQTS